MSRLDHDANVRPLGAGRRAGGRHRAAGPTSTRRPVSCRSGSTTIWCHTEPARRPRLRRRGACRPAGAARCRRAQGGLLRAFVVPSYLLRLLRRVTPQGKPQAKSAARSYQHRRRYGLPALPGVQTVQRYRRNDRNRRHDLVKGKEGGSRRPEGLSTKTARARPCRAMNTENAVYGMTAPRAASSRKTRRADTTKVSTSGSRP